MSEQKTYIKCSVCGAEYDDGVQDCTRCGAPLHIQAKENANKNIKQKIHEIVSNRLITSLSTFVVSILLFALAFTPFAQINLQKTDKSTDTLDVLISPAEGIYLTVAGFEGMTNRELKKTDIYEDMLQAEEDGDDEAAMNALFSLTMLSQKTEIGIGFVLSAIFSALYIVLCVVLMLLSFISLIRELMKKGSSPKTRRKCTSLIWRIALMLPLLGFCSVLMCNVGISTVVKGLGCSGYSVGFSYGFFTSLVIAVLTAVFVSIEYFERLVFKTHENKGRKIKRDIIAIAFAVILIVSVFLPFGKITLSTNILRGEYQSVLDYTAADMGIPSSDDIKYFSKITKNNAKAALTDAPIDVYFDTNEHSDYANTIYSMVMISYARLDITALNIGISLVALFVLLFSGLIIHKKISVILFSRKVKRLRTNLILNFVLSFALLVLTFVVALIARNALQSGLSLYIKFEPAIGPIVAFFSGLLLLIFSKQKEQKKVDLTYDDPDVSYAPYVVDDN